MVRIRVALAGWLACWASPLPGQPVPGASVPAGPAVHRSPVPLEASVLLLSRNDYRQSQSLIRRAMGYGCHRVNVVVTLHCEVAEDDTLHSLGIGHVRRSGRGDYVPLTGEMLQELEADLRACFSEAVARRVDLVILPHLDSNGRRDRWRNYFRFDPVGPIAGFTYERAMLRTILSALDVTRNSDTQVALNLAGEMGTTVFAHADKYREILVRMREERSDIEYGFNLNHNGIEGERPPSADDCRSVQSLIQECDFVGFSNYRPVRVRPQKQDFEDAVVYFLAELKRLDLRLSPDVPLHFSEVGIGGGTAEGDGLDPEAVAATPYAGPRYGAPSPWTIPALRDLRRQYHTALLEYLSDPTGPHPVTAAFLWSQASWDPLYRGSPANFDATILAQVRRHNAWVSATSRELP